MTGWGGVLGGAPRLSLPRIVRQGWGRGANPWCDLHGKQRISLYTKGSASTPAVLGARWLRSASQALGEDGNGTVLRHTLWALRLSSRRRGWGHEGSTAIAVLWVHSPLRHFPSVSGSKSTFTHVVGPGMVVPTSPGNRDSIWTRDPACYLRR